MAEGNTSDQAVSAMAFDIVRESVTADSAQRIEVVDAYLRDELKLESKDRDHILKQLEKMQGAYDTIVLRLVRVKRPDPPAEPELPFPDTQTWE